MAIVNCNDICCLIITYNPDERLFELINNISNQVNKIIIVDNNSSTPNLNDLITSKKDDNIIVLQNKENLGIAKALNQGILWANTMKFKWVLTFDQDSNPFNNIIDLFTIVYNLYPLKSKIGAIGVNYPEKTTGGFFKYKDTKLYKEKDYLITSGCFLSVRSFTEIGGFREDFFIDNVDLEYSLRLKKNRMVSLITKEFGMNHRVGTPKRKEILGLNFSSSNHNETRRYYMARNNILLTREYFLRFPYFILKTNFFFVVSLFQILLVDDNMKAKIKATIRGIKDGIIYSSKFKKLT